MNVVQVTKSVLLSTVFVFCMSPIALAADIEIVQVQFENSCNTEVQSEFNHAVTMLHSFEYLETARIFNEIIEQDQRGRSDHCDGAT